MQFTMIIYFNNFKQVGRNDMETELKRRNECVHDNDCRYECKRKTIFNKKSTTETFRLHF